MNNSAMARAFRVLKDKPMVLLLIIPMQALRVLSLKFLPDFSGMLNLSNFASSGSIIDSAFMTNYMIFMLINSLLSLVTLAGTFLLVPPAMELFRDGAAGVKSEDGWYLRGIRKHWWKPVISDLIVGAIVGAVAVVIYILFLVLSLIISPLLSQLFAGAGTSSSAIEGTALIYGLIIGGFIGGAAGLAALVIKSVFAMFLPALADSGFGAAFRLMFSRKGLRKFFKAFGGLLLISLVPGLIFLILGLAYLTLNGIPGDSLGIVTALMNFFRSWTGVLGMLLISLTGVVTYAFEFSLYQQVKEEELPSQPGLRPGGMGEQQPQAATSPGGMGEQQPQAATSPGGMGEQWPQAATSPGGMGEQWPQATTSPDLNEDLPQESKSNSDNGSQE